MAQYIFNEEVIWQDKRKGQYLVPFIIITVILALLAALSCLLPKIVFNLWSSAPGFIYKLAEFLIPLQFKIIFAVVFGVLAAVVLLTGILTFKKPRLFVTQKRICLMKGKKNYREVRVDKIDAIKVVCGRIFIYAGGRRVFSFGPVENAFATRNCIAGMIETLIFGMEEEETGESDFGEIGSYEATGTE